MKRKTEAWRKWRLPSGEAENEYIDRLYVWQDGRCAMCGHTDSSGLVRDHCHLTGLVRGLLCRSCNSWEGRAFGDEWDAWRAGDNPAAAIKHFEIYVSNYGGTTPLSPYGSLHQYTRDEKRAWFKQVVLDLEAGAPWPADAPWTEACEARQQADREELNRVFANWDFMKRPAPEATS